MSIDLSDLLMPELVFAGMAPANTKALFHQIAASAAPVIGVDAKRLASGLVSRERLGSTGFGGGVAIPHARINALPRIMAVVARLADAIDFKAVDNIPVDIVIALFSPTHVGSEHLKALARVSRRLRDSGFVAKLRGAGSRDALYALLHTDEARDAA